MVVRWGLTGYDGSASTAGPPGWPGYGAGGPGYEVVGSGYIRGCPG